LYPKNKVFVSWKIDIFSGE